jgi:hypothetical protein
MLSQQGRQKLIEASSRGRKDGTLKETVKRIDEVLFELHAREPMSFITTAHKNEEGEVFYNDINGLLDERNFYDYPITAQRLNSFIKPKKNA